MSQIRSQELCKEGSINERKGPFNQKGRVHGTKSDRDKYIACFITYNI